MYAEEVRHPQVKWRVKSAINIPEITSWVISEFIINSFSDLLVLLCYTVTLLFLLQVQKASVLVSSTVLASFS